MVVSSSDLVLAAGISFWFRVVETHNIKNIGDSYQLITALREFLEQNKNEKLKGSKLENNEEYIPQHVQEEDKEGGVDPIKSVETTLSNSEDRDLDDLFEVIDTTEEIEIKEERILSEATEQNRSENVDKVTASKVQVDIRLAEKNVEDRTEQVTEKLKEKSIGIKIEGNCKSNKKRKVKQVLQKHCDYCEAIFPRFVYLRQHMSLDHKEKMEDFVKKHKTFHCDRCSQSFYSDRRVYEHLRKHHNDDFKCRFCDQTFYTEKEMRRHEIKHEKKGQNIPCGNCDKFFISPQTLAVHLASKKCEIVVCPHCPKKMRRSFLKHHLPSHEDALYCKFCRQRFSSKDHMMRHVKCADCDLLFSSHNEKNNHDFKVHNRNAKLCTICGLKCRGSRHLQNHVKIHGNKELSCKHCEKKFKTQSSLERHERSMHQSDYEKRFRCSYLDCTRAFICSSGLESHMNSHLGLKPYKCEVCDTGFQNVSNRSAHMRNVHKFSKSNKPVTTH